MFYTKKVPKKYVLIATTTTERGCSKCSKADGIKQEDRHLYGAGPLIILPV